MVSFLYSTYPLFRLDKHYFSTAKRFISYSPSDGKNLGFSILPEGHFTSFGMPVSSK